MSQIDPLSHPPFAALHRSCLWFTYLARLSQTVVHQPNQPALRWVDVAASKVHAALPVLSVSQEYSYGELWHTACMLAAHFGDSGVQPGDRVLLVFPFTSLDFIVAFLACLLHGCVSCPAYPPDPRRSAAAVPKLQQSQRTLGARHALCNAQCAKWKAVSRLQPGVRWPSELQWISTTSTQQVAAADYKQHSALYQQIHAAILTRAAVCCQPSSQPQNLRLPGNAPALVQAAYMRALEAIQRSVHQPTHLAFIQHTSGSTSDPKGVMVHHAAFNNCIALMSCNYPHIAVDQLDPASGEPAMTVEQVRQFTWLPFYHDLGLVFGFLFPLHVRGVVHAMSPLDFMRYPASWVIGMSQFSANVSAAPNFAFNLVTRRWLLIPEHVRPKLQLSHVKDVLNAAEAVHQSTVDAFSAAFTPSGFSERAILPSYGQAEVVVFTCVEKAPRIVHNTQHAHLISCGSGYDQNLTSIVIVKPQRQEGAGEAVEVDWEEGSHKAGDNRVRLCDDNEVGEIWVSSCSMALGYWQDPERTAATFHNTLPSSAPDHLRLAPNGEVRCWLATGDLGCLEAGHLYITGRKKELIILQGVNVYPVDLEHSLLPFDQLRRGCCAALGLTAQEAMQAYKFRLLEQRGKKKLDDSQHGPSTALATEQLVLVAEVKDERMKNEPLHALVNGIVARIAAEHGHRVSAVCLMPPQALPKTTSGKLRRVLLRQQVIQYELSKAPLVVVSTGLTDGTGQSANSEQPQSNSGGAGVALAEVLLPPWDWTVPVEQRTVVIADSILQLIAEHSAIAHKQLVDEDVQLGDLGIDSMQSVTLLHSLRTHMQHSLTTAGLDDAQLAALDDLFSPTLLYEFTSVRALADHLASFSSNPVDANVSPTASGDSSSDFHVAVDIAQHLDTTSVTAADSSSMRTTQVSTSCYLLCSVGQFIALTAYWFWMLLCASYAFHVIALIFSRVSLLATLAVVPFVYLAFGLSLCCSVVLVKWTLLGRVRAGRHCVWGWFFLRWWLVDRYVAWTHLLILHHLQGTTLYRLFLIAMGCSSAYKADVLDTTSISDWDLVELGERCVVASDVVIQGHSLQGQWLLLSPVRLGYGVHVQHRATVVPAFTRIVQQKGAGPSPAVIETQSVIAAGHRGNSSPAIEQPGVRLAPPTAPSSPCILPIDVPPPTIAGAAKISICSLLRPPRGILCDSSHLYAEHVAVVLSVSVAYQVLLRLSHAMGLLSSELASDALSWPSATSFSAAVALPYSVLVFLVGPQWLAPFVFWLARPSLTTAEVQALLAAPTLFDWFRSTLLRSRFVLQLVLAAALSYLVYVWTLATVLTIWRLAVRFVIWTAASHDSVSAWYPLNGLVDGVQSAWAGAARRWSFSLSFVYSATSFHTWALRAMGASIGHEVILADTRQWEAPERVEVGARSFIGDLSSVQMQVYACELSNSLLPSVVLGKVSLGTNCLLGMLASIAPIPLSQSAAVLPHSAMIGAGSHFGLHAHQVIQKRRAAAAAPPSSTSSAALSTAAVLFGHSIMWRTGDTECPPWPLWFRLVYELLWPLLVSTVEMWLLVLALLPTATASLCLLDRYGFWWTALANCALGWLLWLSVVCLVVASRWLLLGRFCPSQHSLASHFFLRRLVFNHQLAFLRALGLETWQSTQLLVGLYRLLGANIGSLVVCNSILVTEPDLLDVGSCTSIDSQAVLFSHVVERGMMTLAHTVIGRACRVGQRAVLLCGSRMDDGVALAHSSVSMKGQHMRGQQLTKGGADLRGTHEYVGVPAICRRF